MHSFEEIKKRIEAFDFGSKRFDLIVAIANGGIIPAAMLNQRLCIDFQILKLSFRDPSQNPKYASPQLMEEITFDIQGKSVLLVEDRVKSGATLEKARELMRERGAGSVKTFAVNGKADYSLLDVPCFKFPWLL